MKINADNGHYEYKGHFIIEEQHPKLIGKYAIYTDIDEDTVRFVSRADTLKEARMIINSHKEKQK
jgi:hypothetical protein